MVQIIAIVLLIAALIGGAEMWKYKAVQAGKAEVHAEQLERDLKEEKNVSTQKQKVIDYADKLSGERAAEAKVNGERLAAIEKQFNALGKNNPAVAKWRADRVPEPERQLRRSAFGGTPEISLVRNPNVQPATDQRAAADGRDERAAIERSRQVTSSAASVQSGQAGRTQDVVVPEPTTDSILDRINKLHKGLKQ